MDAFDLCDQSRVTTSHPKVSKVRATEPVPENKSRAFRFWDGGGLCGELDAGTFVQEDLEFGVSSLKIPWTIFVHEMLVEPLSDNIGGSSKGGLGELGGSDFGNEGVGTGNCG